MGVTFVGELLAGGAKVVVKLPKAEAGRAAPLVRRLYQEAWALKALRHPHIGRMLDLGVDEPRRQPFLILELLAGPNLYRYVRTHGPLAEPEVLVLAEALGSALDHAHDHQVLHRDLNPGNVIVAPGGPREGVWLVDFGLARPLLPDDAPPLTAPGAAVGSPAYMSPEQITGGIVDARSDLYALGCLLYFSATGTPPYAEVGEAPLQVMEAQLRRPPPILPPQLSDRRAPTPALQQLFVELLKKSRLERPERGELLLARYRRAEGHTVPAFPAPTALIPSPLESPTTVAPRPLDLADAPESAAHVPRPTPNASSRRVRPRWVLPTLLGLALAFGLLVASALRPAPSPAPPSTLGRPAPPSPAPGPGPPAVEAVPKNTPEAPRVAPVRAVTATGTVAPRPIAPPTPRRTKGRPEVPAPRPPNDDVNIPVW